MHIGLHQDVRCLIDSSGLLPWSESSSFWACLLEATEFVMVALGAWNSGEEVR